MKSTAVPTRASTSTRAWSKAEEVIVKNLHYQPQRLSSGELAKTLLSTFNKNLGKFSSSTTFDIYIRWLEAQRHAPQTTINYNWKNVILQWAQSLKARNFTLEELIFKVERWKRLNGPFQDSKTEVNPRYPPTIDQLELAYKMDLKAHGLRKAPVPSQVQDCYIPGNRREGSGGSEPTRMPPRHKGLQWCKSCRTRTSSVLAQEANVDKLATDESNRCSICGLLKDNDFASQQDALSSAAVSLRELKTQDITKSPARQYSQQPSSSPPRTSGTIGLFVMNVGRYTNDEVIQIFHPDCWNTITRVEAWLTNRTVHFETIEGRDRAYYLLPDDLKTRKERDLTRPLVKIFCERVNKARSDVDNGNVDSTENKLTRPDGDKYTREEVGLYFTNAESYSRKDVEILLHEKDILNVIAIKRLRRSDIVVLFPTMHLRDRALDHLPSYLKDSRKSSSKTSLLVTPFNSMLHDKPRDRSNSPDKFYSPREGLSSRRIVTTSSTARKAIPCWEDTHDGNYDFRLSDRRFSDYGRLSRHEMSRDSSCGDSRHDRECFDETKSPVYSHVNQHEGKINQEFNAEGYMAWEPDHGDIDAELWLEKLSDEIMERSGKLDELTCHNIREVQKHVDCIEGLKNILEEEDAEDKDVTALAASIVHDVSIAKVNLKRPRTPDGIAHKRLGDGLKRVKLNSRSSGLLSGFVDEVSDDDGLDCSSLDLTTMKRPSALHMWNIHDKTKRQAIPIEDKAADSSEQAEIVVRADDLEIAREYDKELRDMSSPESGQCSPRFYCSGPSGSNASNASDPEEWSQHDA